MTLEKLPPVLVLHLKRFVYEKTGGCQKLIKNIEYPVDLEISKGNVGKAGAGGGRYSGLRKPAPRPRFSDGGIQEALLCAFLCLKFLSYRIW